jgi:hypothetical protein
MPFSYSKPGTVAPPSSDERSTTVPKPRTGPIQQSSVVGRGRSSVVSRQPSENDTRPRQQPHPSNTAGQIQLHTHFRIFGQWPVVGRQTSEQRDTSPSDGLRPPSCPDRPKTQQNLIHNHQRTQRPTRDQSSDDSRQNTTITKPLTNQTLTNRNPPTTDDWRLTSEPGDGRVRTDDPLLAKQVLSQLSYAPVSVVGLQSTVAREDNGQRRQWPAAHPSDD